ncbi:hypothetical protein [Streptomyces flaveus]|nr:hypothetical protein [Streptomyces flaveus]
MPAPERSPPRWLVHGGCLLSQISHTKPLSLASSGIAETPPRTLG